MFLDEVEIDAPGFQNQRARSLIIGYATLAPTDIMIWSIHYDPETNSPHEFPLASSLGCDRAGGVGTCSAQGLVAAGANIFKIRHDVDFLAGATKPRLDPCAHIRADGRFPAVCPGSNGTGNNIAEQFAILSPIPHEIQARTGRKFASMQPGGTPFITIDINGNEATNGQYLFPFGMGLGGISTPEMNEINLDAMATPLSFTGLPWNHDRRLSPGGCIDTTGDGVVDCEATPQPLTPFPFEGSAMDPRTLGNLPTGIYADPNYVSGSISIRDRMLSYVDPHQPNRNNGIGVNNEGNFTAAIFQWDAHSAAPSTGSPGGDPVGDTPSIDLGQAGGLICSHQSEFNSPPTVQNDVATTGVGQPVTISVLTNDSDLNAADVLTVSAVGAASNGTVAIDNGTKVIYAPSPGFAGTDSFTYTVTDGLASVNGTVTVSVNASKPTAVADTITTAEDIQVTIPVLANDTADNSQAGSSILSVASMTTPANGSVTTTGSAAIDKDQKIIYTPKPNFNGTDTFTYTLADGRGGLSTATITVTVTAVNDTPTAVADITSVTVGTPGIINVLANDKDVDVGDQLTVSFKLTDTKPSKGTVSTNGTTVTYTANPTATAVTDTFSYTVTDMGGLISSATVTVSVVPVTDTLTTTLTEFRSSKSEWRVSGTGSVEGNTVTVRFGRLAQPAGSTNCNITPTANGCILGTSTLPVTAGLWDVRIRGGVTPGSATEVTAWSSGGGSSTSFITTRR